MADRFYEKEAKRMKREKSFRFKFQDLISEVADRAQVLQLQGKSVTKQQTVKVAAVTGGASGSFRDILRDSPPKQQGPLPSKAVAVQYKCRYCQQGHQTEACVKLMSLSLQQRMEALKRAGFCFRCLTKGHMEKNCTQVLPPICKSCKMGHQTMLHNSTARAPTRGAPSGNGGTGGAGGSEGAATGAQGGAGTQEESTTA